MKTSVPRIMTTERIRRRFSEDEIRHLVQRSISKMMQSPDPVTEWVSQYRTIYGEVAVVYAKQPHSAVVAYQDELPSELLADMGGGNNSANGFKFSNEEWKKRVQALWQTTGGNFGHE